MAEILNDDNFENETSNGVVLVDFFAEWCGPCKMVAPVIDAVSNELNDAKIVKVNVDEAPMTSAQFGIRSIPTIVALRDGEEVERHIGANPDKEFYLDLVERTKL